ncbi:tRNA-specific 2-thiouridylase mnmA, partial [Candidatus Arthromitus sp. SFB-3]
MDKKRVVIGLSGGVDSAVAAYLLKKEGYEVIGIMLNLSQNDEVYLLKEGGCCSLSSVLDARKVAELLDIPFYVLNYKDIFKDKVVDYFVKDYMIGNTPNPCIECNRHIKFGEFLIGAKKLGADYIATGHYANIEEFNGKFILKRGIDHKKDQTYMLYVLNQDQLKNILMPCGKYTKEQVREIAKE